MLRILGIAISRALSMCLKPAELQQRWQDPLPQSRGRSTAVIRERRKSLRKKGYNSPVRPPVEPQQGTAACVFFRLLMLRTHRCLLASTSRIARFFKCLLVLGRELHRLQSLGFNISCETSRSNPGMPQSNPTVSEDIMYKDGWC